MSEPLHKTAPEHTTMADDNIINIASQRQRQAANPEAHCFVSASAGSGKTRVLTDRVLRLLLRGTVPERILCLTFTKAAAAEMRQRLSLQLRHWVTCPDTQLTQELLALTGEATSEVRHYLPKARCLFAEILESSTGVRLQTIDAFAQGILRLFPLEAGISPHFEVIDDATSHEFLRGSINQILLQAEEKPFSALGRALATMSGRYSREGFHELLQQLLADRHFLAEAIADHGGVKPLQQGVAEFLGLEPGEDPTNIVAAACYDGEFDDDGLMEAIFLLSASDIETDKKLAERIQKWLAEGDDRPIRFWDYADCFLTQTGSIRKTLASKQSMEDVGEVLLTEAARVQRVWQAYRAASVLSGTVATLSLGNEILQHYHNTKQQAGLLDYDDLVDKTTHLLQSTEHAWVQYRLDGGIDHVLVDEAQDTSPRRWAVIKSLVDNFFEQEATTSTKRSLFVVGDEKQSIYSFQGADPEVFTNWRNHMHQLASERQLPLSLVEMDVSFRSTEGVLQLVDTVFNRDEIRQGVAVAAFSHQAARAKQAGRIELWPLLSKEKNQAEDGDTPTLWDLPKQRQQADKPDALLAQQISSQIAHWLQTGKSLRGRPINAGDILILVRRRNEFYDLLIKSLKQANIPVAGRDRITLNEAPATLDILHLLDFLLQADDDLGLATVLKGSFVGMDDATLFNFCHQRPASLWEQFSSLVEQPAHQSWKTVRDWLDALRQAQDFSSCHELLMKILYSPCPSSAISGREAVLARLGVDMEEVLDELLEEARRFSSHNKGSSLTAFAEHLRNNDAEIKRESSHSNGYLRVMTVHGAKGLQAPIVILPDTTLLKAQTPPPILWGRDSEQHLLPLLIPPSNKRELRTIEMVENWQNKQQAEYRRQLYVALTRAEDELIIAGWKGVRDIQEHSWYNLIKHGVVNLLSLDHDKETSDKLVIETHHQPASPTIETAPLPPDSVAIALEKPAWLLTPAAVEDRILPTTNTQQGKVYDAAATQRGADIHLLLQALIPHAEKERPIIADIIINTKKIAPHLKEHVLSLLERQDLQFLWDGDIKLELPVAGLLNSAKIFRRIDLLTIKEDVIFLTDFKSGDMGSNIPEAYRLQLLEYQQLLQPLWPAKKITAGILWVDSGIYSALD
ncbi:MAG: double-strand break repair helicase AddA [Alphaproteobacteria bacterium]